jgi:hypothetical protein
MNEDELNDIAGLPAEQPDYNSIEFILKNLKLRTPQLSDESNVLLSARKEVAVTVAYQLCFYIYCILHAFDSKFEGLKAPKNRGDESVSKKREKRSKEHTGPMILIIGGTGYLAQQAIYMLTEFGLKSRLLIFCRGEI